MQLFPHQTKLVNDVRDAWSVGHRNVMMVLPTGGGKSVCLSHILRDHDGYSAAIAHRQELVSQLAVTLARNNVQHRIIAPRNVIKNIVKIQVDLLGKSWYNPNARTAVIGVNTLAARIDHADVSAFTKRCGMVVVDEGHHVLANNLWGKALQLFREDARGLFPTATPCRADGRGLGRHADGLADVMVRGPEQRWLIENGFLCDYRLICRPNEQMVSKLDTMHAGASGDLTHKQLREAAKDSSIVGDVVEHYQKYAAGKLGVTFAPDIETAREFETRFNAAGIPAKLVTADTPDAERFNIRRDFEARRYLQLINVDLFGEGFDLPAIEVVQMARRTDSLSLFMQQFGRALRTMQGKSHAIVIDHVNNYVRHGLPDKYREWSLDRRERRSSKQKDPDDIPLTACLNVTCAMPYERFRTACPWCGAVRPVSSRGAPEFVDGDLHELDPVFLSQLRGEVAKVDGPCYVPQGVPSHARGRVELNHTNRQSAQALLREMIAQWAGWQRAAGLNDREIHKKFFLGFGVDVMTAQTLGAPEALVLIGKVCSHMGKPEPVVSLAEAPDSIEQRVYDYLLEHGDSSPGAVCRALNLSRSSAKCGVLRSPRIFSKGSTSRVIWTLNVKFINPNIEQLIYDYLVEHGDSKPANIVKFLNLTGTSAKRAVINSNRIFIVGSGSVNKRWSLNENLKVLNTEQRIYNYLLEHGDSKPIEIMNALAISKTGVRAAMNESKRIFRKDSGTNTLWTLDKPVKPVHTDRN